MEPVVSELYYLSIDEAGRLIRSGDLSPVELIRAYLDRIEATDDVLHSYIRTVPGSALSEAEAAEREIRNGGYRGPLHGIPVALKDLYDTQGIHTTFASKVYDKRIPSKDATTTARLKAAGCVLLGKLAMSELAMTGPPGFGEEPRNPWDTDRVAGWSSSGSGAAVAAGLCAGSLGSDTGGSIRFPAAWCGIVGLMPSYGRVSRYGVMPLSWTLDHAGPLTRTVEDAALMLEAVAGYDPRDPTTSTAPVPAYRTGLSGDVGGLTIGVVRQAIEGIDEEIRDAIERAIDDLEGLGARVEDVAIPNYEHAHIANSIIYLAEGFEIYREVLSARSQDLTRIFRTYGYLGALFTGTDYVQAQRLRSRMRRDVHEIFESVDLLVLPITTGLAEKLEDVDPFMLIEPGDSAFSEIFNLAACPALSVPCGFTKTELPIGLQMAARPFAESTLLNAAYAYQQCRPWHKTHPPGLAGC